MIRSRLLRRESILDYPGGPSVIRRVRVREIRRCYAAGFKDGGRGHEPRNAGNLQKLEKARNTILSRAFRRNTTWLTHFGLMTSGAVRC